MRHKILMLVVLLSSFISAGTSDATAQQRESNSFLRSLSFEWYGGKVYQGYDGYSTDARLGIAVVKAPTLNTLFSSGADAWGDLLLLPGIKSGIINGSGGTEKSEVQLLSPEFSVHYPLLNISPVGIYAGPAAEAVYTDNGTQYILAPTLGVDLGLMVAVSPNFSLSVENRWMLVVKSDPIDNVANFPHDTYSYICVGVHFALPWHAEDDGVEQARGAYEMKSAAAVLAADGALKKKIHENDSLTFENAELKKQAESRQASVQVRVDTVVKPESIEPFDPATRAQETEYVFTRDPFKGGVLVNDAYLKNVLIDIVDDAYVWQISAKTSRTQDAEKIRNYFAAFNGNLGRRIAIVPDERVRTFKLTCLGRVRAGGVHVKEN